jgi:hypothetical protein
VSCACSSTVLFKDSRLNRAFNSAVIIHEQYLVSDCHLLHLGLMAQSSRDQIMLLEMVVYCETKCFRLNQVDIKLAEYGGTKCLYSRPL